jgi:hypothetical protein
MLLLRNGLSHELLWNQGLAPRRLVLRGLQEFRGQSVLADLDLRPLSGYGRSCEADANQERWVVFVVEEGDGGVYGDDLVTCILHHQYPRDTHR